MELENVLINIEGKEVARIEYRDQPVITFRMIDELHQRPIGTARKAFNRNKKRFIENVDFFEVPYEEWSKISAVYEREAAVSKNKRISLYEQQPVVAEEKRTASRGKKRIAAREKKASVPEQQSAASEEKKISIRFSDSSNTGQRNSMKFMTQSGYMMLVKPFKDELAWKIQRALVQSYFVARNMPVPESEPEMECRIPIEMLAEKVEAAMRIVRTLGLKGNAAALSANRFVKNATGYDCLELMGATQLFEVSNEQLELPMTPKEPKTLSEPEMALSKPDGPTSLQAVGCFVEDMCYVGPGYESSKEELFYSYTRYCSKNGFNILDDASFLEKLFDVVSESEMYQGRIKGIALQAERYADLI